MPARTLAAPRGRNGGGGGVHDDDDDDVKGDAGTDNPPPARARRRAASPARRGRAAGGDGDGGGDGGRFAARLLAWSAVLLVGLLAFTKGFFLTRVELPNKSVCVAPPPARSGGGGGAPSAAAAPPAADAASGIPGGDAGLGKDADGNACWWPPAHEPGASSQDAPSSLRWLASKLGAAASRDGGHRAESGARPKPVQPFRRVVMLLIDALRLDFVNPTTMASVRAGDATRTGLYLNRLVTLRDAARYYPNRTLLFRLDADPPTTTMQRLKGITTGGLPTFIDIKDDVASERIEEDNVFHQLRAAQRRVVFMGDDTWVKLFAEDAFIRSFPYPSFNVKDLDTVDNGVLEHLHPELDKDDWDVVVGHFLGVDHAGHRYGPGHPEMARKLSEMDAAVAGVMRFVDRNPDTLLMVLGDHGMTQEGNHGGASEEERSAALFLYSPVPIKGFSQALRHTLDEDVRDGIPTVEQVDLAPSLALLLGLPIPFGNLGVLVPHLFLSEAWTGDYASAEEGLLAAVTVNVRQVLRYLDEYSAANGGAGVPRSAREALRAQADAVLADGTLGVADKVNALRQVGRRAAKEARALWVQFDVVSITIGAALCAAAALGLANLAWSVWRAEGMVGKTSIDVLDADDASAFDAASAADEGSGAALLLGRLPGEARAAAQERPPPLGVALLTAVALELAALLSNSFIVAETWVATLMLATVLLVDGRARVKPLALAAALAAVRAGPVVGDVMRVAGHEAKRNAATHVGVALVAALAVYGFASRRRLDAEGLVLVLQRTAVAVFWGLLPKLDLLPRFVYVSGLATFATHPARRAGALVAPLALVLGPSSPPALLCAALVARAGQEAFAGRGADWQWGVFVALAVVAFFHYTGHECDFGSLRITAPYVGFEEFGYWRGVVMLTCDTFGAHILGALAVLTHPSPGSAARRRPAAAAYVAVFAARAAVTTCFVAAQRRHLMVWAIFAPKFVFDTCAFAAAAGTVCAWELGDALLRRRRKAA